MAYIITEAPAVATAPPPQAPMLPGEAEGGTIMILLIGFFLWYILKHKKARPSHVGAAFIAGVLLAGSVLGLMARQISSSIGTGMQAVLNVTTTTGSGNGTGR